MSNQPHQLPLSVHLRSDAKLERFVDASCSALCSALKAVSEGVGDEQIVYLYGLPLTGRSYLLQAVCNTAEALGRQAIYIPLTQRHELSVDMLEGLDQFDVVCIDDVDSISGLNDWQESVFHLFNRLRDGGKTLIVAGSEAPKHLPLELLDLKSRLGWGLVFKLEPLSDELKVLVLKQEATARGLVLGDDLARYLLNHGSRDLGTQFQYIEQLDRASLQAQRKLSIPFAKEVLNWN